jgi:hypothetical protein
MNRAELEQRSSAYLDALVARDIASVARTADCRLTENGQDLAFGDGLWGTASARGNYTHIAADPERTAAGMIAVLQENGLPVIVGIRLAWRGTELAEAEHVVSRSDILFYKNGPQNLEAMGAPAPLWSEPLAASERMTREELIAAANGYFETLEANDGTLHCSFEDDCRRLDNGVFATQAPEFDKEDGKPFYALGPADQFRLGYFRFVTPIRERRFEVIDLERGVILAQPFLDHPGTIHEVELTDGRRVPVGVKQPFTWQIFEMFKIRRSRIAQIEVLLNMVPYKMRSGW